MSATLSIIVPHYTEPWEVVSKFFSMLDMQRGISWDDFTVTIVNDGENHAFTGETEEYLSSRPYAVKQLNIPHGGVSAARNAGLMAATEEWVIFCDCDDMFSNPYSMRDILTVLPAPDYDMLWAEFFVEDTRKDGEFILYNRTEQNCVFCHAKLYRRQFLIDHQLFFNTDLTFNEDSEFNAIFLTYVDYKRTGKIRSVCPLYIWCWRKDSTTKTPHRHIEAVLCHYRRNLSVVEAHRKNLPYNRYCGMVARTCIDAYYALNIPVLPPELAEMKKEFKAWYLAHKKQWQDTDLETLKQAKAISRSERAWIEHDQDSPIIDGYDYTVNESVTVTQWLNNLEKEEL